MVEAADMQSAARTFFTASHFAVAGASSAPHKYGNILFQWYLSRGATPVALNPTSSSISVRGQDYQTVSSPSSLQDPKDTSLSVVTPPSVTRTLLKEAKKAGVKSVWLQPGSFGDEELEYAVREWPDAAVGGFSKGTRGGEGWCVLVDGDKYMKEAGKEGKL